MLLLMLMISKAERCSEYVTWRWVDECFLCFLCFYVLLCFICSSVSMLCVLLCVLCVCSIQLHSCHIPINWVELSRWVWCVYVDYMTARACFIRPSVISLADNCSSVYNHQLLLVSSTRNSQPRQLICRSFIRFLLSFVVLVLGCSGIFIVITQMF